MWTAESVLVCALALLPRSATSFPPIVLLESRPVDVSRRADAFVRRDDPHIYLLTDTSWFRWARQTTYPCGDLAPLRQIAGVVVHEEWHLRHPGDEAGAYVAQLAALVSAGAKPGGTLYANVRRSMREALSAGRLAASTR